MKLLGPAALIALSCILAPSSAWAEDHPLVGSYKGSESYGHKSVDYDETWLITGPIKPDHTTDSPGWKKLEGKIDYYYYQVPKGVSSLAMMRNFEKSLKDKGVDIKFSCTVSDGNCFISNSTEYGVSLGMALDTPVDMPRVGDSDLVRNMIKDDKARYIYGVKQDGDHVTHISLTMSGGIEMTGKVIVKTVESAEMATDQIEVTKADAMKKELDAAGLINIYGITFDFDKADIKPESEPQLQQIANLMNDNPGLNLSVVGHTDDQGGADYNLDLSSRRADAVVDALAGKYGVKRDRLFASGAGLSQPIASNDTEEGRAKNRRVMLVKP